MPDDGRPLSGKPPSEVLARSRLCFDVPEFMVPKSIAEVRRWARMIALAEWAPDSYRKIDGQYSRPKIALAILHGASVGFGPIAAVQSIAVIEGMPTIWGDGALSLVERSGLLEDMIEEYQFDDEEGLVAVCTISRRGRPTPISNRFSMAMAEQARLTQKEGPWQSYPQRMLRMRARSWTIRDAFPDVLRGLQVREEVEDFANTRSLRAPLAKPVEHPAAGWHDVRVPRLRRAPQVSVTARKRTADRAASTLDDPLSVEGPFFSDDEIRRPNAVAAEAARAVKEPADLEPPNEGRAGGAASDLEPPVLIVMHQVVPALPCSLAAAPPELLPADGPAPARAQVAEEAEAASASVVLPEPAIAAQSPISPSECAAPEVTNSDPVLATALEGDVAAVRCPPPMSSAERPLNKQDGEAQAQVNGTVEPVAQSDVLSPAVSSVGHRWAVQRPKRLRHEEFRLKARRSESPSPVPVSPDRQPSGEGDQGQQQIPLSPDHSETLPPEAAFSANTTPAVSQPVNRLRRDADPSDPLAIDPGWGDQKLFQHYRAELRALYADGSGKASALVEFRDANRVLEARLRRRLPHLMKQVDAIYACAALNAE